MKSGFDWFDFRSSYNLLRIRTGRLSSQKLGLMRGLIIKSPLAAECSVHGGNKVCCTPIVRIPWWAWQEAADGDEGKKNAHKPDSVHHHYSSHVSCKLTTVVPIRNNSMYIGRHRGRILLFTHQRKLAVLLDCQRRTKNASGSLEELGRSVDGSSRYILYLYKHSQLSK